MPRDRMNYQKEFLSVTSEADKMERERKKRYTQNRTVHKKRERERERNVQLQHGPTDGGALH